MREYKIIVEIDRDGKVFSETKGFHGPMCIQALDDLFKDIVEFDAVNNTDDYYKKVETTDTTIKIGKVGK